MTQETIGYDEIVQRVLANYALLEPHATFIRHSDNMTYKVTTAGSKSYLLRIHIPVTSAMGAHGSDHDMVNSEVTWLLALAHETDLTLQEPVRNTSGALVTRIPGEEGSAINATLLGWVEGVPYHRDLETEATAHQIGVLLAKLHQQASHWSIPRGFTRPRRDGAYFEGVLKGIQPAVRDGRISAADYAVYEQSIASLAELMGGLEVVPQEHGIMHADAHKGNMLLHEGNIRLIDFSFCAIGNFMFDLAVCLSDMKKELHESCLQGYQSLRQLPPGYQRLIEGFFVGSIVGTFSFWVPLPHMQETLARKVPQVARDYAVKFNQGEHFWL